MNLIKKLNEPFPGNENLKKNIKDILWVGLFITFFFYTFHPFGLLQFPGNILLLSIGYGLITITFGSSYFFISNKILNISQNSPSWTLWKWILHTLGLLTFIAIGNFLLMLVLSKIMDFPVQHFSNILKSTILVGTMPVIFSGFIIQGRAKYRNEKEASLFKGKQKSDSVNKSVLHLFSHNKKQELKIEEHQFLYAEARQNYVSICFLEEEEIKEELLRNTLKQIQAQLAESNIFRCHQSYLVNTALIEKVEGNAQGLRLTLQYPQSPIIPVSRKYIPSLKAILV